MSPAMLLLFANLLMYADGLITRWDVIVFLLIVGGTILAGLIGVIVQLWIPRMRARRWPTVSAVVDFVSVTFSPQRLLIT